MKVAPMIFLLAAAIAVGCSSQRVDKVGDYTTSASDRLARTISSSTSPEAMESTYLEIIQDENSEQRLEEHFERLVKIYNHSNTLVNEYDAKLDEMYEHQDKFNGADLVTDKSYARVMAAWILSNREIERISYVYKKNLEAVSGKKNKSSNVSNDKELKLKKSFTKIFNKYGQEESLAMQNLLTHLEEVVQGNTNEFDKWKFKSIEEQVAFQKRMKMKKTSKSSLSDFDRSIESEIAALEPEVSEHLNEMFEGRSPQSAGSVVPSSSSKGNLTGNTFRTGRWALTYDDGPSAKYTSKALDNLDAHGMKTSFFWLAKLTPSYPTLINRAKSLGMALGNHSYSHANLPKQGQASLNREINESTAIHTRLFGFKPTYFRCPYGACGGNGSNIRQMIANQGMVHIFWNIDSLDWQDKNPASIVNRVTKAMAVAKKGIILFHDIHPQSVEATRLLMDSWTPQVRAGNMRLVTIPQAIEELNSDAGMQ